MSEDKMQDLLSSRLQFTDLKPDEQVVLADTVTQVGLGDGVKFSCWYWQN